MILSLALVVHWGHSGSLYGIRAGRWDLGVHLSRWRHGRLLAFPWHTHKLPTALI